MWAGIAYAVVAVWGVFAVATRHSYARTTVLCALVAWTVALAAPLLHPPADMLFIIAAGFVLLTSGFMAKTKQVGVGSLVHGILLLSMQLGALDTMCIGIATIVVGTAVTIEENADRVQNMRAAPTPTATSRIFTATTRSPPKLFM